MPDVTAARVVVWGRVQGVGFRYSAYYQAVRLGVTGWVRNLPGGEVAALVQGDSARVEAMIEWLRSGPRAARVTGTSIEPVEPDPDLTTFDILA